MFSGMMCGKAARGGVAGGGGGGGGTRAAALALAHVNLLLMLFSGAGLATSARLKWDPTAYIPLREALPLEYRAAAALLCLSAVALLLLAHLALAAVTARWHNNTRRVVLLLYAFLMGALVCAEGAAVGWVWWRARCWLHSEAARDLASLLEAREHLDAALLILQRWFTLPDKLNALITEAKADLPRNGYAAGGAAVTLVTLQCAALVLALVAAARRPRAPAPAPSLDTLDSVASAGSYSRPDHHSRIKYYSEVGRRAEQAPLRTAYKNGRLVVVSPPPDLK